MLRQSPVRKEKVFKDHVEHDSKSVAVLSIVHPTWRNIFHVGSPVCIQSTLPTCFPFLQVPQPLRARSLPSSSPSCSECLFTIQTKHHQPPADSHQHLLFWVTFPPFIKKMTLSQLPLNPSTVQLCFGQPLPETPYQLLCSTTSVILSILHCCDPFPAAKISCSPLPHPQRAYKFRVSNLFMNSLSVVH